MLRIEYLSHGIKQFNFPETKEEAIKIAENLCGLDWVSGVKIIEDDKKSESYECWALDGDIIHCDELGITICQQPPAWNAPAGHSLWEANAKRIVACVNACRGIPTNVMLTEDYSFKAELDSLDEQINKRVQAEKALADYQKSIDGGKSC